MKPRGAILAATVLAAVLAGAAPPSDFDTTLRRAQDHLNQRKCAEAVRACDQLLADCKEPSQIQQVRRLKAQALAGEGKPGAAIAELDALRNEFAADSKCQAASLLLTGDIQRGRQAFDEAVAAYRKVADEFGTQEHETAEALLRAGDILCAEKKEPAKGIAFYKEVEAKFSAKAPVRAAEAVRRTAGAQEALPDGLVEAAVSYRKLTKEYASVYDDRSRVTFHTKRVECWKRAGKLPEALAAARDAEKESETVPPKADFAVRQGDLLREARKPAEARLAYLYAICAYPLEVNACQTAQAGAVETCREESRWADALGGARILYDAAGNETSIRNAAQIVAQAFLAVDGNLARANSFLNYQRFGASGPDGKPNTEDDVPVNFFAQIKYPVFTAEENKLFQTAIEAQPKNYEGYRAKGYLCAYWGKPKDSAANFFQAFKAVALDRVPAAAEELVIVGIKAHTASFSGLDRVFEFITFGPKGKNGKENLPDPFAGL